MAEEKDIEEDLFLDYLKILKVADYWALRWGRNQVLDYWFKPFIFL